MGAEVSPDGRWVAWSWSRLGPTADVYATRTDGSGQPVRLTASDEDVYVVSWTPDASAVIVSQDTGGDERVRLFRVRLAEPGEMEPLTEASPNYFVWGGHLHPNGRWLLYGANVDAEGGEAIEATWIYRHDLATGERLALARPRRGSYYAPQFNDSGDLVLYHRTDEDPAGLQVWLVDSEGERDREILNFGASVKVEASWLPDGRRVLFVAEAETHRRLGVWEDGSIDGCSTIPAATWITPSSPRTAGRWSSRRSSTRGPGRRSWILIPAKRYPRRAPRGPWCRWRGYLFAGIRIQGRSPGPRVLDLRDDHRPAVRGDEGVIPRRRQG